MMKLRFFLITTITFLLVGCNVTLAEDITPPPGYVHPTPVPTLVLFPSQAPNVANGKAIYAEKCAACHGDTGLGDGEQGIQLGVTVRAFGLPEIARPASPAQYYTMVTRGNIERFMPPFASLNDQERWDVIAYAFTLHTTPEQIARGKEIFESKCANCSIEYFKNQQVMSTLTEVELARIAKQGNDQIPAFGADLNEDDLWAVAAYLRTLSFDSTPLDQTQGEPAASVASSASPEATPAAPANEAKPGLGNVRGAVENKTGESLPSNLVVTLTGYDHDASNPNAAPVESFSVDGTLNADGSYSFDNIDMPANRIFVARVTVEDVTLQSGFAIAEEGAQSVEIPTLTIYPITEDSSGLVMDSAQFIFDYAADSISVYTLYSFRNPTDKIIAVRQDASGEIPFIKFPAGSFGFSFEPTQDSEPFVPTENGFAIPPSDKAYGLLASSSLGLDNAVSFSQTFTMPVASINIFAPLGVTLEDSNLVDYGVQTIQGYQYQLYESDALNAGDSLQFTLTGSPKESSTTTGNNNVGLLIGAAALGLALIGSGWWIYRQDKPKQADDEERGDEFASADDVMDAIIALDDLHGRKKISEKAYQNRRGELKEALKKELEK